MYKRTNEQLQKEGAMALVTGASSGIGLAYARELAVAVTTCCWSATNRSGSGRWPKSWLRLSA